MDTGGIGSFPGLILPTLAAANRLMFQRKEVMDKIALLLLLLLRDYNEKQAWIQVIAVLTGVNQ